MEGDITTIELLGRSPPENISWSRKNESIFADITDPTAGVFAAGTEVLLPGNSNGLAETYALF